MATTLNVRHPRDPALARELTQRRGTDITGALIEALEHDLERERSATPLAQCLAALAERARSKAGPNPRPVTEADRDAVWER